MTCDEPLVMEELVVPEAFMHADSLADELDRDRVARGADRPRASLATRRVCTCS
jgi:hypothetical protein